MTPVSVCIIARNEENKIARCLESLLPFSFEIIVVDTGSTDRTKEVASKYTKSIYDFTWTDDFSEARNFSISKASYDWIFMIDCDEAVKSLDLEELNYFRLNLPSAVGSVNRENLSGSAENPEYYTDRTERFFNRRLYTYTGMIHEQLTPKSGKPFDNFLLNATLFHDGYQLSPAKREEKAHRNLSLLQKQLEREPENPYLYYQLGKACEMVFDYPAACSYYAKGLEFDLEPQLAFVQAMTIAYGRCLLQTGNREQALQLEAVYDSFSDSADFVYLMGIIYRENGLYENALEEFGKAVTFEFANENGANSWLAYEQMADILVLAGEKELARDCYLMCGDYPPAREAIRRLEQTHES